MRKRFAKSTFFTLVLTLLLSACSFNFSSANIKNAVLAKDEDGNQTTTKFDPTDTIYLVFDLENAPDDTTVKAVFIAVDVGDAAAPNTTIDEATLTNGSGQVFFNLAPGVNWVPGKYKVDLYLNDELNSSHPYEVPGEVAQAPAPAAGGSSGDSGEDDVVAPPASGAVASLEDVQGAVVQIVAQGSFVHPEFGAVQNVAGAGSGFIIDPSGIAVTNYHVVGGSALLKVFVAGEDEPRNAKILGVSECSDLAVIDIEGDGFPYMEWYADEVKVGLDMYVAGFPLGNPEYTLTRGIISKQEAGGETPWASVDHVLEYDATTNGGNSGGAVVDENGRVLAVHYAGNSSSRQAFGIGGDIAQEVVAQLRQGENVDSIGINGEAVRSEDGSVMGIWVSSVESGSPADAAGLQGGDILTQLEGLVLGVNGSKSDYCDILRSHNADDVLSVEVLRFATSEILTGRLNSDEGLETAVSFADQFADTTQDTAPSEAGPVVYDYVTVTDASGILAVEVPSQWVEVNGSEWVADGEVIGNMIRASSNLDSYFDTWDTPGMVFGASHTLSQSMNEQVLIEEFDLSDSCSYDGRFNYSDSLYTGLYDIYSDCGGVGTGFIVLTAVPEARNFVILVQVQIITDADLEALDHIIASFIVDQ